ncbi:MAG: hypothetical protein RIR26_2965 [Pseudomonadota bacterium]
MVTEMNFITRSALRLLNQAFQVHVLSKILLVILGLAQLPAFSIASAAEQKLKEETELHLSLTEQAFSKLIQSVAPTAERIQRTDLYFDSHNGSEFVLRRNVEEAKLRIQMRDDSFVIQKSWLIDSSTVNTGEYEWMVSKRESSVVKQSLKGDLPEKIAQSLTVLSSGVTRNSLSLSQKTLLENLWSTLPWPRLTDFDSAAQRWPIQWVPAALVKKERWLIPISPTGKKNAPLYIQLGRDTDVLGSGKPQAFEVELELSRDLEESDSEIADKVSLWLLRHGIVTEDTKVPTRTDFFRRLESLYP